MLVAQLRGREAGLDHGHQRACRRAARTRTPMVVSKLEPSSRVSVVVIRIRRGRLDRLEHVAVVVELVARRAERDRPDAADAQVAVASRRSSRACPCRRTRAGRRESVKASKTRSGGRRSAARTSGRGSRAASGGPLDVALEAIEPALPRPAMPFDPRRRLGEARRTEPAVARAADLLGDHEVDALEDPDVLLDPVDRQPERLRELADRGRAPAQTLEDLAPRRVGEREERAVECR